MFNYLLSLIGFGIVYFLWKFVVKVLLEIRYYQQFSGAIKLKFVPVLGAFAFLEESYKKYKDQLYLTKLSEEGFPGHKFFITSFSSYVVVDVSDPDIIKDYYVNKEKYYKKLELTYKNKQRIFGAGVAFSEGKEWSRRRKIMTSLFHYEFFQRFYPKLEETVDTIIGQIKDGQFVDSMEVGCKVAGQNILKCFFGQNIHGMNLFGESITVALARLLGQSSVQEQSIWYMTFGPKFFDLGLRKIDRDINKRIRIIRGIGKDTIKNLVQKYSKIGKEENLQDVNFVRLAIEQGYLDGKGQMYITTEELIEEWFTFFVGGMDTTAHLMAMSLYYLSVHQEIQDKLRKEIEGTKELTLMELGKLPYLDAFVNESNRHYSFITSIFPRIATQDHQLGHIAMKKGSVLMFNWMGNNYSKRFYTAPFEFNPERMLDGKAQALEQSYIFTPFSMGKRSCIGKTLALIETKLLIVKTLKMFKLSLKPGYELKLVQRSLYEPEDRLQIVFDRLNRTN